MLFISLELFLALLRLLQSVETVCAQLSVETQGGLKG